MIWIRFEPDVEIIKAGFEVNKIFFVYKGAVRLKRLKKFDLF